MTNCNLRLKKEIQRMLDDSNPDILITLKQKEFSDFEALITGPDDSPFELRTFKLSIHVPESYPFEPPAMRFITPIYHPNIDSGGRICLDTLKVQPHGTWSPISGINSLLLSIRLLMGNPNADDGLVPEITEEYRRNRSSWEAKAREHSRVHALSSVHKETIAESTPTLEFIDVVYPFKGPAVFSDDEIDSDEDEAELEYSVQEQSLSESQEQELGHEGHIDLTAECNDGKKRKWHTRSMGNRVNNG